VQTEQQRFVDSPEGLAAREHWLRRWERSGLYPVLPQPEPPRGGEDTLRHTCLAVKPLEQRASRTLPGCAALATLAQAIHACADRPTTDTLRVTAITPYMNRTRRFVNSLGYFDNRVQVSLLAEQHFERTLQNATSEWMNILRHGQYPFELIVRELFTDQYVSPSLALSVAEQLAELAERRLPGVWNTSGATVLNRVEFAQALCKRFGFKGDNITPTRLEDLKLASPRPKRSGLDVSKARRATRPGRPRRPKGARSTAPASSSRSHASSITCASFPCRRKRATVIPQTAWTICARGTDSSSPIRAPTSSARWTKPTTASGATSRARTRAPKA